VLPISHAASKEVALAISVTSRATALAPWLALAAILD
jgi:hypothetical protein